MADYQSLIERKLQPQSTSGNDIIYICPCCDDKSGHLYINYNKEKWHCFKCDAGGKKLDNLLRILDISADFDYGKLYDNRDNLLDDIIGLKNTKITEDKVVDYSTDLTVLTEYYKAHIQPLSVTAYQYLLSRGLDDNTIMSLGLCEGLNRFGEDVWINGKEYQGRDYSGRIMIPSFRREGGISFYLGRDYTNTKSNKYINPVKELAVASEDVWNLDIIQSDTVIICEGVMTAISVNQALGKIVACATYGKSIAEKSSDDTIKVTSQGEKLLNKKFKTYIMFYDKDALKEAYKNASYLHDRGAHVRIVHIDTDKYGPKADANDMTVDEIKYHIVNSKEFSVFGESGLT